ncbi:hypothetical protein O0L34_g11653 [Tuta absoluta]|nr:hypothetical protein O0L34_g11653 [Tuta absoluta]
MGAKENKAFESLEKDLCGATNRNVICGKVIPPIPGHNVIKFKMASSNKKSGWLMGCGAFGVVMGAIAVVYWPVVFVGTLRKMMTLNPTSMSFEIWRDVPIPMYLECYLWNISNVDEILANKATKIKMVQMGPYTYKESHVRKNLTWINENSTVTYYSEKTWHFVPEMSNGSLSDMVTNVNPIIATVAYFMRYQRNILKVPVDIFLRTVHDNMFLTANASAWLFDGIDDPVMDIANRIPNLPIDIPFDKFGWFYGRNASMTYDGIFNINTGAADFSKLGKVETWNYSNRSVYRDECGAIRGSTGELWAPKLDQTEVDVFAADLCTFVTLTRTNDSVEVLGIKGVQFAANESIFDNGWRYPERACFCDEVRDENCVPSGAMNISICRYGAPAFISLPHFLYSDPYYPSKLEGLEPNEDLNFKLALEMVTGMPLSVSAHIQANLLIRHIPGISINNILPDNDTMVPAFWFRQSLSITENYARLARTALNLNKGLPYGFYAMTAIGTVLLLFGVLILVRKIMRSPDTEPIIDQEERASQ